MNMPYHKELLRSSVSLCFREFFVFRNKAKGVMTLLCQFEKMIYSYLYGRMDEDLKQYILIHIALNISKFKI